MLWWFIDKDKQWEETLVDLRPILKAAVISVYWLQNILIQMVFRVTALQGLRCLTTRRHAIPQMLLRANEILVAMVVHASREMGRCLRAAARLIMKEKDVKLSLPLRRPVRRFLLQQTLSTKPQFTSYATRKLISSAIRGTPVFLRPGFVIIKRIVAMDQTRLTVRLFFCVDAISLDANLVGNPFVYRVAGSAMVMMIVRMDLMS